MDEKSDIFVTAIRDNALEGAVASVIRQKGWTLALRGTESSQIVHFIERFPTAHLIASENFKGIDSLLSLSPTMITHNSEREISLLLESIVSISHNQREIPRLAHPNAIAFISSGRRVGTTICALNHAKRAANNGKRVLLIDAHLASPSIAHYLDLHQITQQPIDISPHLSVAEVNSLESINLASQWAREFEVIYIDLGEYREKHLEHGRRLSEEVLRWGLASASQVNLLSLSHQPYRGASFHPAISEVHFSEEIVMGRKRQQLINQLEADRGRHVTLYPWDRKAMARGRSGSGFLIDEAPKSPLARAITSHADLQLFFTHARIPSTHSR